MQSANRHSAQIERAVIDAVECVLLLPRVGATFEAVVVDRNENGAIVQLTQPAVVASMASDAASARPIVRLESVDPVAGRWDSIFLRAHRRNSCSLASTWICS